MPGASVTRTSIVVSPDVGGVVRARALAKQLDDADLAIIDKRRPRANEVKVMNIIGDVKDRSCVLIDDLVDTAGTLCLAAEALKEQGARRVVAYITHPVLSGKAVERISTVEARRAGRHRHHPAFRRGQSLRSHPRADGGQRCWPRRSAACATKSRSARCTSTEKVFWKVTRVGRDRASCCNCQESIYMGKSIRSRRRNAHRPGQGCEPSPASCAGKVPAILYGGKGQPTNLTLDQLQAAER